MPKKEWSEEERKAFGEKMKQAREKKVGEIKEPSTNNDDIGDLLARVKELEAALNYRQQSAAQGPQVTSRGVVGTFNKYIIDPKNYPDPCERLAREPRLQRFAFPTNYELAFSLGRTNYQSIDGVNTAEPKFTLELNKIIFDEETGEPTNGRYTICRGIFHEDPEAAIIVAREYGLPVDEENQKDFLDEMRYLRMRDWLLEAFYPPKVEAKKNKKQVVIGNTLVDYFEISSENKESIPFGELNKKF